MSRRGQSLPPNFMEKPRRSSCTAAICFSWKVFTCVLSHVTLVSLVVAYCIGGAFLFKHLEGDHEMEVKKEARHIRENISEYMWKITETLDVLYEENWTIKAEENLKIFEEQILTLMKTRGWDGEDDTNHTQWTLFGSLFYSIIVITTIGYGHIAPRTSWGKVTTIFYAILGIPLMLLCLSNIGDVMASSFRFLYWRICCFVCTREPKKSRRNRSSRSSFRQPHRFASRSQPPPVIRRSVRASQRSGDSGFVTSYEHGGIIHAYSDPELRYTSFDVDQQRHLKIHDFHKEFEMDEKDRNFNQTFRNSRFSNKIKNRDRLRDRHTVDRDVRRKSADLIENLEIPAKRTQSSRTMRTTSMTRDLNRIRSQTLPIRVQQPRSPKTRSKSVDPRVMQYDDIDEEIECKAPVYCNKYAIDYLDRRESIGRERRDSIGRERRDSIGRDHHRRVSVTKTQGMPRGMHVQHQSRYGNRLELPPVVVPISRISRFDDYEEEFEDVFEMIPPVKERRHYSHSSAKRERAAPPPPSPRIMSPMGFAVHRQARLTIPDDDSYYDDEWDSYGELSARNRPVPIWLCVFLVISYIIAGAFLFSEWEKWTFLDSAYFCFITLTTIGFGDFVPAQGVKDNSKESIALCSLYLLFGISLLAMSFNLVQEEVIANVKDVARRLGILKEEEIDE